MYHFSRPDQNSKFVLVLHQMSKQAPFIRKIIGDQTLNTNILTMDIETVNINGTLIPYLICWYDGHTVRSYWNQDFKNFDHLVSSMMGDLCIRKYRDHKIYLHNFSSFDGIFLLKALTKIGNCKIIQKEGRLYSLQSKDSNNIILTFIV